MIAHYFGLYSPRQWVNIISVYICFAILLQTWSYCPIVVLFVKMCSKSCNFHWRVIFNNKFCNLPLIFCHLFWKLTSKNLGAKISTVAAYIFQVIYFFYCNQTKQNMSLTGTGNWAKKKKMTMQWGPVQKSKLKPWTMTSVLATQVTEHTTVNKGL